MSVKQNYIFFFLATAAAVGLRTAMLFFTIDPASGFIKTEYLIFGGAILGIILLAAALIFTFSILTGNSASKTSPDGRASRLSSAALALVILYDTLFTTVNPMTPVWQRTLEFVFAAVAAVALIIYALGDNVSISLPPIITAVPVLYWFIRLVIVFSALSTLANIPDNMFELAAICLILLSSLWCSKLFCIEVSKKQQTLMQAILLTTAFACFTASVPRAIVLFSGNEPLLHKTGLPIMTPFVAGVYFLVFSLSCFPFKNNTD